MLDGQKLQLLRARRKVAPLSWDKNNGPSLFTMQDVLNQHETTREDIAEICDFVKELLISKNEKYGDSALNPVRIFSSSDGIEQLKVRIDDKLSRISRGAGCLGSDEDVITDLIGYLVLLKIAFKRESVFSDIYEDVKIQDSLTGLTSFSSDYWPNDPWKNSYGQYRVSD